MINTAVLLTCHNRREKTLACLRSFSNASRIEGMQFKIFVVDDGSTDETADKISNEFPDVNLVIGSGTLFWAGGMRLAWQTATAFDVDFDFYLLINDDTLLYENALEILFKDVKTLGNERTIFVGSTLNHNGDALSYGGRKLYNRWNPKSYRISPNGVSPQPCDLGNANIMLVSNPVVQQIGILSDRYTHGIADYDYTLRATKNDIGVFIASSYLGMCDNDHEDNWLPSSSTLTRRIRYLYSVKGLAYHEYIYYIKTHFPKHTYIAISKLWIKTFFPILWEKRKHITNR